MGWHREMGWEMDWKWIETVVARTCWWMLSDGLLIASKSVSSTRRKKREEEEYLSNDTSLFFLFIYFIFFYFFLFWFYFDVCSSPPLEAVGKPTTQPSGAESSQRKLGKWLPWSWWKVFQMGREVAEEEMGSVFWKWRRDSFVSWDSTAILEVFHRCLCGLFWGLLRFCKDFSRVRLS